MKRGFDVAGPEKGPFAWRSLGLDLASCGRHGQGESIAKEKQERAEKRKFFREKRCSLQLDVIAYKKRKKIRELDKKTDKQTLASEQFQNEMALKRRNRHT